MKRTIQKALSLLLAAAMILSMGVLPAFAEGAEGGDSMPNLEIPVSGGSGSGSTDMPVLAPEGAPIEQTEEEPLTSNARMADAVTEGVTVEKTGDYAWDIFANGSPIIIAQKDRNDQYSYIYIDENRNGAVDEGEEPLDLPGVYEDTRFGFGYFLINSRIYGGSKTADVAGDTSVTLDGGIVWQIFGGNHTSGTVTGDTHVTMNDGTTQYIYGGGAGYSDADATYVTGSTYVALNGGNVINNLYGGGGWRGATVGNSKVTVTGGEVWNVFGGGEEKSEVAGTATVVISCGDGNIKGGVYGGGAGFSNTNAIVANADIQFISGNVSPIVGGGGGFNGTSNTTGDVNIRMEGGKTQFIYDRLNASTAVTGDVSVAVTGGEIYTGGCVLGSEGTGSTGAVSISVGKDATFAEYTYIGIKQPVGGTLDIDMDGLYVPIILQPDVLKNAAQATLTYRNLGSADGTWAQYNDNPNAVTKGSNPYLDWINFNGNKFDEMTFKDSYVDFKETGTSAAPKGFDTVTDKLTLDGGAMRVFFTMDTRFPTTEFKNNPLLYYGHHIKGGNFGTSVIKFASATGTAMVQLMARDGNPKTNPLPVEGVSQSGFDCVVAPTDTPDGTFLLQNSTATEGKCYWGTNTYGSGGENNKVWQVVNQSNCSCPLGTATLEKTVFYTMEGGTASGTLKDVRVLGENQCKIVGHNANPCVVSYALSEAEGTTAPGAAISGDQLSATGVGRIKVAVTARSGLQLKTEEVSVYVVECPADTYRFNMNTDHADYKDIALVYKGTNLTKDEIINLSIKTDSDGIAYLEYDKDYTDTVNGDTLTLTIKKEYLAALGAVAQQEYEFAVRNMVNSDRFSVLVHTVKIRVSDKNAAVVTLTPSKTEGVVYGDKVTYRASVAKGNGADAAELTGTVQFQVDGSNYGEPLALAAASATIDHTKLTAGTHTITATYSGDDNYAENTGSLTTTVDKAPIKVKAALDKASIYVGDALPTPSIAYEGLVGNDTLTPNTAATFDGMPANSNTVGTHTITWSNRAAMQTEIEALPSYANYTATYTDTITLTLESRPSSGGGTTSTTKPPVIETLPDGTVIKTQVTTKTDSSTGAKVVQETVTTTKPDGTVTKVETITVSGGRDGVTACVTTEINAVGEANVTATVTAKDGETSVKLPAAVVKATEGDKITGTSVAVTVGGVTLTFDAKALAALKKTAATPTVTVTPTVAKNLPEAIRDTATAYDFTAGEKSVNFGEGIVVVSISYEKKDAAKAIAVYFVAEDGSLARASDALYQNGVVSFPQSHWSTYAIVEETALPFADVAEGDWYYEAVRYAFAHKLFSGTSATAFSPDAPMTRAMLMTVLARLDGQDTTIGTTWDEVGMRWAKEKGISDGLNPTENITREQLAVMLYRYAGSPAAPNLVLDFADADKVSDWAASALRWTVDKGILSGKGANLLDPAGHATRAEVAAVFSRYMGKTN